MDVIQAARDLGRAVQADARYQRVMAAQDKNDGDKALQDVIGAFNLKRTQLNAEIQKPEKDQARIKELDAELKDMYNKIFENPNMKEYSEAKADMEEMLQHINIIVTNSSNGFDPDDIDPFAENCGGSCASCAGCG